MPCFICGEKKLYKFLDLGYHPPSDAFLRLSDLLKPEATYPLELCLCESCYLVQLNYVVDPEKLFCDYVYNTGTNNSLKKSFEILVNNLVKGYKLSMNDLAIDIGSNDGTLLSYYIPHKVKILGIDPSSATSIALNNKIPTVVDFFTQKLAAEVSLKQGRAKIITATNVFAHVNQLDDFLAGVKNLLTDDGIFVSESGYLLDFIEKLQYDSIYHEHLRYYSLKPMQALFKKHGLEVIDVERGFIHGGSLIVYAAQRGKYPVAQSVAKLIKLEAKSGLYKKETFNNFAERVKKNKLNLQKLVLDIKAKGGRIAGIGAPAKGNTLLNYCKLDKETIDYLVEKSDLKIGAFTPGMHIPVVSEERLYLDQPDYALMLSWNIADELIPKIKGKGYQGKFIVPHPEPKIIN